MMATQKHSDSRKGCLYIFLVVFLTMVLSFGINFSLQGLGVSSNVVHLITEITTYVVIGIVLFVAGVILLKRLGVGSKTVYLASSVFALCFMVMPIIRFIFQRFGMSKSDTSTISGVIMGGIGLLVGSIALKKVQKR